MALALESRHSKDQILAAYINQINYDRGWYGIQTAARNYFGKSATELNVAEGAMLAAIRQYPALNRWRARGDDDFGIMLLEMWAYIADVQAFYDGQARIDATPLARRMAEEEGLDLAAGDLLHAQRDAPLLAELGDQPLVAVVDPQRHLETDVLEVVDGAVEERGGFLRGVHFRDLSGGHARPLGGFGDHARLAHALGQQNLPQGIVDFMDLYRQVLNQETRGFRAVQNVIDNQQFELLSRYNFLYDSATKTPRHQDYSEIFIPYQKNSD